MREIRSRVYRKTDLSKENAHVTTDIDDQLTVKPTAVTKGEGEGNGSFHNGGHLEKSASPENEVKE